MVVFHSPGVIVPALYEGVLTLRVRIARFDNYPQGWVSNDIIGNQNFCAT
jgi:hypothetical protein